MKLLAHSVVPTNPVPYLHLGYSAAASNNAMLGGIFVWLLGVYLVVRMRQKPMAASVVGVVCLVLGVLLFIQANVAKRHMTSRLWLMHLRHDIQMYHFDHNTAATLQVLQTDEAYRKHCADTWGRPIQLTSRTDAGVITYHLRSAGKDGRFGTKDDLTDTCIVELQPVKESAPVGTHEPE